MITYIKGPIGWAVLKDGKPVGRISRSGTGEYVVNIKGFRVGTPETRGTHSFKSLALAKTKCKQVLS